MISTSKRTLGTESPLRRHSSQRSSPRSHSADSLYSPVSQPVLQRPSLGPSLRMSQSPSRRQHQQLRHHQQQQLQQLQQKSPKPMNSNAVLSTPTSSAANRRLLRLESPIPRSPLLRKSTMTRKKKPVSTSWKKLIDEVMNNGDHFLHIQDEAKKDQRDHLGIHLADVLNASPQFRYQSSSRSADPSGDRDPASMQQHIQQHIHDDSTVPAIGPLFSSKNLQLLQNMMQCLRYGIIRLDWRRHLQYVRHVLTSQQVSPSTPPISTQQPPPQQQSSSISMSISPKATTLPWKMSRKQMQKLQKSFLIFIILIILGGITLTIQTCMIAASTFHITTVLSMIILRCLVDVQELEDFLFSRHIQPDAPQPFYTRFLNAAIHHFQWFDDILLAGRIYQGREWDAQGFVFDKRPTAEVRYQRTFNAQATVSRMPPPTVSRDDRWSSQTAQHLCAITFCAVMVHDSTHRKQRRKLQRNEPHLQSVIVEQQPDKDRSQSCGAIELIHESPQQKSRQQQSPATQSLARLDPILSVDDDDDDGDRDSGDTDTDTDTDVMSDSASLTIGPSTTLLSNNSDVDLNWMDVGAEIGMKILGSAHVQRTLASQDTAERILNIKQSVNNQLTARKHRKSAESPGIDAPPLYDGDESSIEDAHSAGDKLDDSISRDALASSADTLTATSKPALSIDVVPRPVHNMWTSASAAAKAVGTPDHQDRKKSSFLHVEVQDHHGSITANESPSRVMARKRWKKVSKQFKAPSGILSMRPREEEDETEVELDGQEVIISGTAKADNGDYLQLAVSVSHEEQELDDDEKKTESIEVVCYKEPDDGVTPNSPPRPLLLPGVKVAVPLFPIQPGCRSNRNVRESQFQMATVVMSKRIYIGSGAKSTSRIRRRRTNCLAVTVKLDRSYLRNGEFAELTYRVMDDWDARFVPKHSKLPIGSCVATMFGLGVLVGWRVEDDVHIVRSLWQRRGPGSALAYLQRDAITATMEAAVGFEVTTALGKGEVLSYTDGGRDFRSGRFFVKIKEEGRHKDNVLELNRCDVRGCDSAQFMPVIEFIRGAAQYQLQLDTYNVAVNEASHRKDDKNDGNRTVTYWENIAKYAGLVWDSFLKAIEEDNEFDEGMNHFLASVINFLENLDKTSNDMHEAAAARSKNRHNNGSNISNNNVSDVIITASTSSVSTGLLEDHQKDENGFWIMNDFFGGVFVNQQQGDYGDIGQVESIEVEHSEYDHKAKLSSYDRTFVLIRALMRTVSIARASCKDDPEFKLGMSICYEFLLFAKTVVKVQQKNTSEKSLKIWRRAWDEVVTTFGPLKERLEKIADGIRQRAEKQGRRAKIRTLRFVDIIVQDDFLLLAVEQGDWFRCAEQIETALVDSKILDDESLEHVKKTAQFLIKHFAGGGGRNGGGAAAARNNAKLVQFANFIQSMATPRRSILKLLLNNDLFDLLERIFVRVFRKEQGASWMLAMHASNFKSLRHLRMLKDLSVSGRLWIPVLDAADAELSWAASRLPANAKDFMLPLANLFSLCVAQFHKISDGDMTQDWLDFLLEEDAERIIHDIDMKLILALESFSKDVQDMMTVLPYYSSIEDDILNLMDEVDLDMFLKEASDAVEDADRLNQFIREKTAIAIERFLAYLPKMSIPIEKRDLGEGWVITCRGADGGDLMLSDVNIRRENLTCQIMGGDTIFFPMLADEDDAESIISATTYESRQYQAAATPMSPKTTSSSAPTATLSSPDVNGQSHAKETRPDSTATASKSPTPTTRASLSSTTSSSKAARSTPYKKRHIENSVLDHIREMLEQAQQFGCWKSGVGGVGQPPTDRYIASVLGGLPVSSVLNCAIELWRNLEIDDDELLEIAIRDVSYQIKLQQEREKSGDDDNDGVDSVDVDPDAQNALDQESNDRTSLSTESVLSKAAPDTRQLLEMQHKKHQQRQASRSSFFGSTTEIPNPDGGSPAQAHSHTRFNPRFDPTVCFLEMKSLSLRLDQFKFCIQKHESKRTIFDPVFQGSGSLIVQNVSMKLRIACVKEHVVKFGSQVAVPVLQLRELDVRLEKVMFKLKDTGADWLLNKVVENFGGKLTDIVATNLKQQVQEQMTVALENINSYFEVNPDLLLSVLGISMDDLDEKVVWV